MLFGPANTAFLRADVDDVAAETLRPQHGLGRLGHGERPARHDLVLQVPVLERGVGQRPGAGDAGVVDDEVDAAEGEHGRLGHRRGDRGRVGDVHGHADGLVRPAEVGGDLGRGVTGRGRRRPRWRPRAASALRGGQTDARRAAGDQGDPAGQRLGLRSALELELLEDPVLDGELLGLGHRRVGRDALGAAHHVDGVDVELPGDPGGLLVGAEGEHADAGHQDDGRGGAAHRRGVRRSRAGRSRRRTRRGRPRSSSASRATTSSSGASGAVSSSSGRTLVRRKWSGQLVPRCTRCVRSSRGTGSRAPRRCR